MARLPPLRTAVTGRPRRLLGRGTPPNQRAPLSSTAFARPGLETDIGFRPFSPGRLPTGPAIGLEVKGKHLRRPGARVVGNVL